MFEIAPPNNKLITREDRCRRSRKFKIKSEVSFGNEDFYKLYEEYIKAKLRDRNQ